MRSEVELLSDIGCDVTGYPPRVAWPPGERYIIGCLGALPATRRATQALDSADTPTQRYCPHHHRAVFGLASWSREYASVHTAGE